MDSIEKLFEMQSDDIKNRVLDISIFLFENPNFIEEVEDLIKTPISDDESDYLLSLSDEDNEEDEILSFSDSDDDILSFDN